MRIQRIYTGPDGRSHVQEEELPHSVQGLVHLSDALPVKEAWMRIDFEALDRDYHNAPRRQLIFTLSGCGEFICGDGTKAVVGPGDIILAEDVDGEGHIQRHTESPRRILVVPLPDGVLERATDPQ